MGSSLFEMEDNPTKVNPNHSTYSTYQPHPWSHESSAMNHVTWFMWCQKIVILRFLSDGHSILQKITQWEFTEINLKSVINTILIIFNKFSLFFGNFDGTSDHTNIYGVPTQKNAFQNLNPKSKFSLILNIFDEDQKPILRVSSRYVAVRRGRWRGSMINHGVIDQLNLYFATQLISIILYNGSSN